MWLPSWRRYALVHAPCSRPLAANHMFRLRWLLHRHDSVLWTTLLMSIGSHAEFRLPCRSPPLRSGQSQLNPPAELKMRFITKAPIHSKGPSIMIRRLVVQSERSCSSSFSHISAKPCSHKQPTHCPRRDLHIRKRWAPVPMRRRLASNFRWG